MLLLKYLFVLFFSTFCVRIAYSQTDTLPNDILETPIQSILKLPVKGLGDVEIVSASKKSEKVFDAPLAATVLTKEEIKASGATSLVEIMKLVPGVMVREISNGNYEIHIRGLEYIPAYSRLNLIANRTTLVMIDGRAVYNHLSGGIFWETLPIDINDIERIEVVRGPSVPLYGANAVSGVIHFITRKKSGSKAFDIVSNLQYGNFNTAIANTSIAHKINDKLDIGFSANYQHRGRTDQQYYSRTAKNYVDRAKLNFGGASPEFIYPDTALSIEKYGLNTYLNYRPASNVDISFKIATQESKGSKIYGENGISNLNHTENKTNMADLAIQIGRLKGQYNYWWGTTDERTALQAAYSFGVQEANIEYNFEKITNLRISPFVSLRSVAYEEIKNAGRSILFSENGIAKGLNYGGGVNLDYLLLKKFRFIMALRAEHFEISKANYLAYQTLVTYKPNDKLLLRFVHGRSNAGTFIYDTFLSISRTTPSAIPNTQLNIQILGNRDLKLLTQDIFEFGGRWKVNNSISFDIEAFASTTKNIPINITQAPQRLSLQLIRQVTQYENNDLIVKQYGLTMATDIALSRLNVKAFITFQQSRLLNFSPFYVTSQVNSQKNITTVTDTTHVATPPYFGGFSLNYPFSKKISIFLNSYFFGKSTYFYLKSIRNPNEPQYLAEIPAQMLLNMKLSYQIDKKLNLFINIRNLFSNANFQHFHTDRMRPLYLLGLNFDM